MKRGTASFENGTAVSLRHLRNVLYLTVCLCLAMPATADPVSPSQAREALAGWLAVNPRPLGMTLGSTIERIQGFTNETDTTAAYYVAFMKPNGLVILAGDDLLEPIVAFGTAAEFEPSAANPLGALVTRDLPGRAQKLRSRRAAAMRRGMPFRPDADMQSSQRKWGHLHSQRKETEGESADNGTELLGEASVSDIRVAPLLDSRWGQTTVSGLTCYNYYTPNGYPAGCVATAMAQLMRYHSHPGTGVGTTSYTITVDGSSESRALRGGDGAGGAYAWTSMLLAPDGSITLAQRQAIGALCHDAGVSVNMDFTSSGSAANTLDAASRLKSVFDFDNAVKGYNSGSNIGSGLNGMVNPGLDAGHPSLLGITGASGGHAVVCDGYGYDTSTLYHHLNMGWSGQDDMWYNLPTIETTSYTFSSVYKCVYNVFVSGSGEIISGRVTDDAGSPLDGVTVTAQRSGGGTYVDTTDTYGIYAIAGIPASSQVTLTASKDAYTFSSLSVTTGSSSDYGSTAGNRWGNDFVATSFSGPDNPTDLQVISTNATRLTVAWQANMNGDDVLLAFSTNGAFGTPSGSLLIDENIDGGGTVIYAGSATPFTHEGLEAGTRVWYKAWSIDDEGVYSSGALPVSALTYRGVPLIEGFESGVIASDWTVVNADGDGNEWDVYNGAPYSGTYFAAVTFNASGNDDWLILPRLALPADAEFSFYARSLDPSYLEHMEVRLSTGGSQPADFTVLLDDDDQVPGSYTRYAYDLSAYEDQRVTLAIRCVSVDEYYLLVDDIAVTGVFPPSMTTASPVTGISHDSASGGGTVTAEGGSAVSERGICWSTNAYPTPSGEHVALGSGTGSFTGTMTGLQPETAYYVRSYAVNSAGTGYGDHVSFTTEPTPGTATLEVASCFAVTDPAAGIHAFAWGTLVTCRVTNTPHIVQEPTSWSSSICTGWTGTGSVPVAGTNTTATFTISEDSTLTWQWAVQDLAISNQVVGISTNVEALRSIEAGNGFRVAPGGNVRMNAGETIRLEPGFRAETGSSLRARPVNR